MFHLDSSILSDSHLKMTLVFSVVSGTGDFVLYAIESSTTCYTISTKNPNLKSIKIILIKCSYITTFKNGRKEKIL